MDIPGFQSEPAEGDAITGGALNITKGAAIGAIIVALITTINGSFDIIFGGDVPTWVKPAVIIATIAVWGLIAAADVLGRAYASGQKTLRTSALPGGLKATYTKDGVTVANYMVVAVETDGSGTADHNKYLITKADQQPNWVEATSLTFQ
jgi:hypothetical protein